jgi:IPT/TIG domain-containing protein
MALKPVTAGMHAIGRLGRASAALLIVCMVAGCHGGDDNPPANSGTAGQQFIVTPANLGFTAAGTGSATPPSRTVQATVTGPTGGTLFARLVVTGDAVDVANSSVQILGPTQARVTVRPASPSSLAVGNHSSVITLIVCNSDSSCSGPQIGGSPATINVAYSVGNFTTPPVPPESLAPSVGAASVQGDVVLRGTGFGSVTSVSFGGTAAVDVTAMSDSEIRATYPALAAGTLNISLSANGTAVPSGQSLTLVPAGTLAAATLAYVTPPQNMRGLAFDPVTQTLFVGVGFSSSTNNQVLSYTFANGLWQLPQAVTVQNLRNIALSLDRARLLALTDTSIIELNPATLVAQPATLPTDVNTTTTDAFLKGIVPTNDGQALITSSSPTSGTGRHWLYAVAGRTVTGPFNSYAFPATGGPDNGTRAVIVQGGTAQPIQQYNAFTGLVTPSAVSFSHFHPVAGRVENINLPAFDRNGNRMLVAGFNAGTFHAVYDANFDELGRVPSGDLTATTAAYAISPDAARAYILQIGAGICRVRAFDLRTPPGAGVQYQEVTIIGFPINLSPNCPSSAFDTPSRILLNPPGDTLFIAGDRLIRVVRLPG